MRATATAKKSAKPAGPTWSKVGSPKPKAAAARPKTSSSRSGPRSSRPAARNPKSKIQSPKPKIAIPAHVQQEISALLLLVAAALFGLGLVTWRAGGQGVVGYMGGFL